MRGLLVLVLLQGPDEPAVGDTVWLDREIRAPAGSLLRPLPWDPGEDAALLGPPEVIARPGGWVLRYPLAFWRAGRHRLVVPGPLVVRADGGLDTLPPRVAEVLIHSLLPATRPDSLPPEPAADLLPVRERTSQPLVILLGAVVVALLPWHWWWRRRGRVGGELDAGAVHPGPTPADLEAWAEAGEWRAAAEGWIARLEQLPASPDGDALLDRLRAARFEAGGAARLPALCREAARR